MKTILLVICAITFITCNAAFAQTRSNCRVDIYLVKKYIHCWDTATKRIIPFKVTLQDLQDTPFIKNEEITTYIFNKFKYQTRHNKNFKWVGKKYTARLHGFETNTSVSARIDSLHLSLFGCAIQFAMVCDGEVIYGGCLNNHLSSWVPPMVDATGRDNSVSLAFYSDSENNIDPRENTKLLDCLKSSGRFRFYKTYDDFKRIRAVKGDIIGHYRTKSDHHFQISADSTYRFIYKENDKKGKVWSRGTWEIRNDTIYFHQGVVFDTVSFNSKNNQLIDSLILSFDTIPERLTQERYQARLKKRYDSNDYSEQDYRLRFFHNKLFFRRQKIFRVKDGKLKSSGYFKSDR